MEAVRKQDKDVERSSGHKKGKAQMQQQVRQSHALASEPHAKQKRVPKKRMRLAESETTAGEPDHADANGEVGTTNDVAAFATGDALETAAATMEDPFRRVGPARSPAGMLGRIVLALQVKIGTGLVRSGLPSHHRAFCTSGRAYWSSILAAMSAGSLVLRP